VVRGSKFLALLVLVASGLLGYAAASGKLKPARPAATPSTANRACDDAAPVGCCASGDGRAALLIRAAGSSPAPVRVEQPQGSE
jgi:hypothetical protein